MAAADVRRYDNNMIYALKYILYTYRLEGTCSLLQYCIIINRSYSLARYVPLYDYIPNTYIYIYKYMPKETALTYLYKWKSFSFFLFFLSLLLLVIGGGCVLFVLFCFVFFVRFRSTPRHSAMVVDRDRPMIVSSLRRKSYSCCCRSAAAT